MPFSLHLGQWVSPLGSCLPTSLQLRFRQTNTLVLSATKASFLTRALPDYFQNIRLKTLKQTPRLKNKNWPLAILTLVLLTALFGVSEKINAPADKSAVSLMKPSSPVEELVLVTRVIDGDTIEIEGGQRVRYIGIDTPETVDPRRPVGCFGGEASVKNKELVEGKYVRLEKDILDKDKYGRLLRYVYVDNKFVNRELVKGGFAHMFTVPPDVKYAEEFLRAEREAREAKRGLWETCATLE